MAIFVTYVDCMNQGQMISYDLMISKTFSISAQPTLKALHSMVTLGAGSLLPCSMKAIGSTVTLCHASKEGVSASSFLA